MNIGDTTEFELELHNELKQNLPRKCLARRQPLVPDAVSDRLVWGSDRLVGGSETETERFSLNDDDVVVEDEDDGEDEDDDEL